jgi:hypothetical protein
MINTFGINLKSLPHDCKVLLDAIDVMERTEGKTVSEVIVELEEEQNKLKYFLGNEVEKRFTQETVDGLLENYNRIINVQDFFKKYVIQ